MGICVCTVDPPQHPTTAPPLPSPLLDLYNWHISLPCAVVFPSLTYPTDRLRGPPGRGEDPVHDLFIVSEISLISLSLGGSDVQEPYCAATCAAVFPSASVEVLRKWASLSGSVIDSRTSFRRSVLFRRQASKRSSFGEAP